MLLILFNGSGQLAPINAPSGGVWAEFRDLIWSEETRLIVWKETRDNVWR
jgi:hypothetical protein